MSADTLDKITLMLVSGVCAEDIEAAAEKLGLTTKQVRTQIKKARESITLAASFNRVEEIGTAYLRLNDLYTRSLKAQDPKTALASQKELNRLLRLYDQKSPADVLNANDGPAAGELSRIASHLLPLGLAAEGYPLHEHARIAADIVRRQQESNDDRDRQL